MVCFWDIDGTLVSESLERRFVRGLLERRPHYRWPNYAADVTRLFFHMPPRWYKMKLAYLRGQSVGDIDEWLDDWFGPVVRPGLYTSAVETVALLSQDGVRQVLVSGTPRPLAERLGDYLGVSEIIAAEPQIRGGQYTGRLLGPHPRGRQKKAQVGEWLINNDLDWSGTAALANHWDDRHLMQAVGLPVAVNPDSKLLGLARRLGWMIVSNAGLSDAFVQVSDRIRS